MKRKLRPPPGRAQGPPLRTSLAPPAVLLVLAFAGAGAEAGIPIVFDQGPDTGTLGPCFDNQAEGDGWADQVSFPDGAVVEGISIFTSEDPGTVTVRTRIFADDGTGSPGVLLREEDRGALVQSVGGGLFQVGVALLTPFLAEPGTTYWYSLSAAPSFAMEQCTVLTPGDGRIARFDGPLFVGHDRSGDQMFWLHGELLSVELQSFSVE